MQTPLHARRHLLMDCGWTFHLGDCVTSPDNTHLSTYMAYKAGEGVGPIRRDFFDGAWRRLDLPHDWAVETPLNPAENLDQGYHARGVAWYRRAFRLDPSEEGRILTLQFDGVATHCTVWVNGTLLQRNWCGYTPFCVDFTDVATYGDEINTVVVRVDATVMEGWWYEGAGIYRHVWLTSTDPVHIALDGVWANPQRRDGDAWDTLVETTLANEGGVSVVVNVISTIYDPDGAPVITATELVDVPMGEQAVAQQCLSVHAPQLWSIETPHLYTLSTEIWRDDELIDDQTTTFGYRTIAFDPNRGFLLNDVPVKLQGTCNHQDHAGVGVAVPDALQYYRIARLKAMGANAYRCAHNPQPVMLEACDRLGMLVMDENRNFNSSAEVLEQVRTLIRRDRNHPCVILWSICNEEPLQGSPAGAKIAQKMIDAARHLDPTRPITAALNGGILNAGGMADVVDVIGINYQLDQFDAFHAARPGCALTGSENGCFFSTRGEYANDPQRNYFSAYDTQAAPWGASARESWRAVSIRPFIAGEFIWTGFDYRGEPSPYTWPSINSHWGIMDTCGFAKDAFYLQQAYWRDEPMLHLLPHWNWPGRDGDTIKVMAYTNCAEVELFLNGRSLGARTVDPIEMAAWDVPYEAGTLRAVGTTRDGRSLESILQTTGEPVELYLEPDRPRLRADLEDTMPVTIAASDAQGRHVPTANNYVTLTLDGPGRILGVGNGDPSCHEPDVASARSLFNGLAQVIIQATDTAGTIRLTATADGLRAITMDIPVMPAAPRAAVPTVGSALLIGSWRMSPVTAERPDPNVEIADSDMNTWERLDITGETPAAFRARDGYAIFRAILPASPGGALLFGGLQGQADIYLNGVLAGRKESTWETEPHTVRIPAGDRPTTISVLIYATGGNGGVIHPVRFVPDQTC